MSVVDTVRILSFDPGLSYSGWNYSSYKLKTGEMVIHRFGMFSPNDKVGSAEMRHKTTRYGQRIMTLDSLRQQLRVLMDTYKPDFVVSEAPFFNATRPTAYCALVQWITTVELVLFDEYRAPLFKLAPKFAKKVVSGFGGAEKLGVQYAILHKDGIRFKQKVEEADLTEHVCDSIGIGYTFIQEILPSLIDIWRFANVSETSEEETQEPGNEN
jgi:Holliday junction resolvasome RuvABC endonuclease subunit